MNEQPGGTALIIEIIDVSADLSQEVQDWVQARVTSRSADPAVDSVRAWRAIADDAGPVGTGRNRLAFLHHISNHTASEQTLATAPAWVAQRHIYTASPVSDRRTLGRPDPGTAKGLRFVAMNCAEGAEDEFHAWYEEDHFPRFTAVPGVLDGRRLHSADTPRHHLAIYWLDDIRVVDDPMWKAAAGTEWTTEMRKKTFDRDRINFVPFFDTE